MATTKKKPKQYIIEDTVIIDNIYPLIEANKNKMSSLKNCIERFIHKRHATLYDYAPVDRIFFKKDDANDFFNSIGIKESDIKTILPNLYYWNDNELQACKDEFTLTAMMALRYLLKEKNSTSTDKKMIELVGIYIAFSGKLYASCHYYWWRFTPKREVMDYVINYMLSNKFDLIKYKSVFGAVQSLVITWIDRYKEELMGDDITDERVVYIIHQLHNRILAFLSNIAKAYYEAYENKLYINAESDNYDQENYRIANTDSSIIANATEKAIIYFANNQVDLNTCNSVAGDGVNPTAIKSIIENILNNNSSIQDLRFVINVMITDFHNKYPNEKDLTGVSFISHSISMKPNTKDQNIIKSKNIVLGWLNTSDRYRNTKTQATKNNYYKSIMGYIAITVYKANMEK